MNRNKKINKKRKAVAGTAIALAGVLTIGASMAFLTDNASTDAKAKAGSIDMVATDLTDLDANVRTWTDSFASTSKLTKNGLQADDFDVKTLAADTDAPSVDMINPGDTGVLAFKVENKGTKSIDTAAKVTVTATMDAAHAKAVTGKDQTLDAAVATDAGAYTIEGLGTPVITKGDTDHSVKLVYYTTLDTLKGSIENSATDSTDGKDASAIYAYNVDFDRSVGNKLTDAKFTVHTDLYAKQHRNTFGTFAAVTGGSQGSAATNDYEGKTVVEETVKQAVVGPTGNQADGRSNVNKTAATTGTLTAASKDWTLVDSFEKVINGSTDAAGDFNGATTKAADTVDTNKVFN